MPLLMEYFIRFSLKYYKYGWLIITAFFFTLYFSGYIAMWYFDEKGVIESYYWWFGVTNTTIGYGDVFPVTTGGRISALIIAMFGIALIPMIVAQLFGSGINLFNKVLRGEIMLKGKNHIVIMGYRGVATDALISEILGDKNRVKREIYLCSSSVHENPYPIDQVHFAYSDDLASDATMIKFNVEEADKIIVHGEDDNQTFLIAYAAREFNTKSHMVSYIKNIDHKSKFKSLPADKAELNQAILPSAVQLMVQEMQDPQSSAVLQQLMSNLEGETIYRTDVPHLDRNIAFRDVKSYFDLELDVDILAVLNGSIQLRPPKTMNLEEGMAIFYIGKERLNEISWDQI